MPTGPDELREDFNQVVDENGIPCVFVTYGTRTYAAGGYDDEQLVSASGTSISGGAIIQPVGDGDRQYVEQGLADWNDSKVYVAGSINLLSNMVITVGNTGSLYEIKGTGIRRYDVSGTTIYQSAFVRHIFSGQHAGIT